MNWLKRIFQSETTENKIVSEAKTTTTVTETIQPETTITVSGKDKFVGIDNDFVNLIYFRDEDERMDYIGRIERILSQLEINEGMDYVAIHQKLTDINYNSQDVPIPFLTDALLFQSFIIYKTESGEINAIEETPTASKRSGAEKIRSYYPALSFSSVNLQRKVENSCFDFQFEENLLISTLEKSDLFNYARIEALFTFGQALYKANDLNKMDIIFDRIRSEKYDLGTSTVADYYRSIGEIYASLKQDDKALDWLKAGLTLNPKLGVKKLIDRLEKK